MPYCTCQRCNQNADCHTVVFEDDEFFTSNVAYTLCNLCYSMYGELYANHTIDDDDEVIYNNQDTDYQEQQVIMQEEDHNPIQALSSNEPCDDPCDLINEDIY